jgi:hypothetical protein
MFHPYSLYSAPNVSKGSGIVCSIHGYFSAPNVSKGSEIVCPIHSHFTAPQTSVKDLGSYVPSIVPLQRPTRPYRIRDRRSHPQSLYSAPHVSKVSGIVCSIHIHFTAPQTSVKDLGSYVPSIFTLQRPKRQ